MESRKSLQQEVDVQPNFSQTTSRNDDIARQEIDIRNYAKYLLREGTDLEKRELLGCLKGKITLRDKKIDLISESHKV